MDGGKCCSRTGERYALSYKHLGVNHLLGLEFPQGCHPTALSQHRVQGRAVHPQLQQRLGQLLTSAGTRHQYPGQGCLHRLEKTPSTFGLGPGMSPSGTRYQVVSLIDINIWGPSYIVTTRRCNNGQRRVREERAATQKLWGEAEEGRGGEWMK